MSFNRALITLFILSMAMPLSATTLDFTFGGSKAIAEIKVTQINKDGTGSEVYRLRGW